MSAEDTSIQYLPGVGPKRAALLEQELNVRTFGDLIRLYPFRYIDRSSLQRIADIRPDLAYVQVMARVVRATLYGPSGAVIDVTSGPVRFNAVKRLSVIVADASGELEVVFFKGIKYNYERLTPGSVFVFFGKPSVFNGKINLVHPEVDAPPAAASPLNSAATPSRYSTSPSGSAAAYSGGTASLYGSATYPSTAASPSNGTGGRQGTIMPGGTLTGVYTSTEKLRNAGVTGRVMTRMVSAALAQCLPSIQETLPEYVLKDNGLCQLRFALQNIHFPQNQDALAKAVARLKFDELFFLQLSLLKQKYVRSRGEVGLMMPKVGAAFNACFEALPYELTGAQKRVIKEIRGDMMSGHQMNRLLQGDVGSGKTMVAVLSSLIAIGNGYQACIMAPTEVLAQQHFANISKYLRPTEVRCALLTGSTTAKERREIHSGLEDGSIGIIVGTHALIEDDVRFKALGLAVIDEQHRFGVEQRAALWKKGPATGSVHSAQQVPPHVLVMTATPIPRTLAMTLYGDLDVSVIDEMPPGRKPVQTLQISQGKRLQLYEFMKKEIARGRQVFVVYPLIFESGKMDLKNLETGYEEIVSAFPFPQYKVAIVHGQQTNEVKNFNMSAFVAGRAQILVSTTVIEVGVDVPNASVMVIESAQRFGLSQLHQLRGRVGRGSDQSYCVLVRDLKTGKEAQKRLDLLCATENGFELAEEDMKMRGPGDLEGTQQSGLPVTLNIASLAKDGMLLGQVRSYAERVLDADPQLSDPRNEPLARELGTGKYTIRDFSAIS